MPSDSIAGFLNTAKASRVLFTEQVEQLIRQPDIPQSDLTALCAYLQDRGVLTRFQADAIRDGRGYELTFINYPVLDLIGPCPGGTAYRALHPSLRTPVLLRRLSAEAYAPTDTVAEVINRARAFGSLAHPNLLPLLDAGTFHGNAYVVLDPPPDAAPLDVLLKEVGGAMPGFLAAEYGWALAAALRTVHERGGWHGEVRPGLVLVGPLTTRAGADGATKRRPAPNATAKLSETGLIPVRGPAADAPPAAGVLAYLPPERVDAAAYGPLGDIYGLGATLYLMLAGRPPHAAGSAGDLLARVRGTEPAPLAPLRPDVPTDLTAVVMRMLSKRPEDRPQTAYEVETALAPFCRPGTLPAAPPPAVPMAAPASAVTANPVPYAVPVAVDAEPEPDAWGVNPNAFADAQTASSADPGPTRRRGLTAREKSRSKMWIAIGLCLHLTAMALLAAWLGGFLSFDSDPDTTPVTKPDKPKQNPKQQTRTKT